MLTKNILIAIFVTMCFKNNSSQRVQPHKQCYNDYDFYNAIRNATMNIVIVIVTTDEHSQINLSIRQKFRHYKTIQVNVGQGGECSQTVQYLKVDTINHVTSVRMMKDDFMVPDVLVIGDDETGLTDGFNAAEKMDTLSLIGNDDQRVSQQISNWVLQPIPTGPPAAPPSIPQAHIMLSGPRAGPPGIPQVIFSGPEVIPAGQSVGSSMTPSQRAGLTFTEQPQPVPRVNDSLSRAPASGRNTSRSGQQTGESSLRYDSIGVFNKSWLTLETSGSGPPDDAGNDAPISEPQSRTTPRWLRPTLTIKKSGAGTSKGPH